jgi:hypothetical protein
MLHKAFRTRLSGRDHFAFIDANAMLRNPVQDALMSAVYVRHMMREFPDPAAILHGSNLRARDLAHPGRFITVEQNLRCLSNAMRAAHSPDWYLPWGLRIKMARPIKTRSLEFVEGAPKNCCAEASVRSARLPICSVSLMPPVFPRHFGVGLACRPGFTLNVWRIRSAATTTDAPGRALEERHVHAADRRAANQPCVHPIRPVRLAPNACSMSLRNILVDACEVQDAA